MIMLSWLAIGITPTELNTRLGDIDLANTPTVGQTITIPPHPPQTIVRVSAPWHIVFVEPAKERNNPGETNQG